MDGEGLDDDILMPTIILHDIGWSDCPRELVDGFFESVRDADTNAKLRTTHMEAGDYRSRQVLDNLDWDVKRIDKIATIIAKHDVASAMTTRAEKLIFDADYSWRFSRAGFYLDLERFAKDPKFTPKNAIRRLEDALSKLKTATGMRIGKRELSARKAEIGA